MTQLHEDAPRLMRQRLLALEDGRDADAILLFDFILMEHGVTIQDVNVADVPPHIRQRWQDVYGLPDSVEIVTVMMSEAREPVWRIPFDLDERGPSWFEVPLHMQQEGWLEETDESGLQDNLKKRTTPLPDDVYATIRTPLDAE